MGRGVWAFAVAMPLVLAACGGGGGSSEQSAGVVPTAPGSGASVSFSLTIPARAPALTTAHVRPSYVSSATQSMTVSINGGAPIAIGLTPATNPGCSGGGGTAIVCTNLTIAAPGGTDSFRFDLFAEALVGGQEPPNPTLLSTYTTAPVTIVPGTANSLGTFTLDPVIASLQIALAATTFTAGTATPADAITVTAKDASGATIVGNGTYVDANGAASPIVISSASSPSGAPFSTALSFTTNGGTAQSTATLNGTSDTSDLSYSGLATSGATISAKAGAVTSNAVSLAFTASAPVITASCAASTDICSGATAPSHASVALSALNDTATLTPSETGWTGSFGQTFVLTSDTCNQTDDPSATGNWATIAPAAGSSAASFSVTAQHAGTSATPSTCTATFTDGLGQSVVVDIAITTASFGVN